MDGMDFNRDLSHNGHFPARFSIQSLSLQQLVSVDSTMFNK